MRKEDILKNKKKFVRDLTSDKLCNIRIPDEILSDFSINQLNVVVDLILQNISGSSSKIMKSILHMIIEEARKFECLEDFEKSMPDEIQPKLIETVWRLSRDFTFTNLRAITGLSRIDFARKYDIPLVTIEAWEFGKSATADYNLELWACDIINEYILS